MGVVGAVPPVVDPLVETDWGFSPSFFTLALGAMRGTAGGVAGTTRVVLVATDVAVDGGAVEDGVVGCVESTSEGGLVVAGVAGSGADGICGCIGVGVRGVCGCDCCCSCGGGLGGGGCRLRLRRRPGNGSPSAEYQGNYVHHVSSQYPTAKAGSDPITYWRYELWPLQNGLSFWRRDSLLWWGRGRRRRRRW